MVFSWPEEGGRMQAQLRRRTFQSEQAGNSRIQLRRSCLLRRTQAECGPNSGEAFVHGRRAFSTNNEGGASMRHLLHCAAIIFASIYSTASASNASSGEIASLTHTEIEPALTGKRPLPSSPISTLSSRLPV